jgi:cytochrome c oxidase subunit II
MSRLVFLPVAVALLLAAGPSGSERVVHVKAKRFEFSPQVIKLKKGERVTLELESLDRKHGFEVPDLHISESIVAGEITRLTLTATRTGTFPFHCNVFCGEGHEDMTGEIVIE